jgi:elongation factor Ts
MPTKRGLAPLFFNRKEFARMTEISAGLVKELRELTGLGFMECKKALTEAHGDLKKAEELLRIRSGAKASKAASRIAAEGVIGAWLAADGKVGALVELNSETDFVAKNEDFVAFARSLAEVVATRDPKDTEALSSLDLLGTRIEARRQALVQKIGENISIRRFKRLQSKGRLALYLHQGSKIGVLVDYEGPQEVGTDLAMHISFYRPQFLLKNEVPADVVAREREIQLARATERARKEGKSPEIAAKMVEGSLNKFLGEITLMGQPFVKDDKQTVEKMLAAKKAKVNGYAFFVVGEGIEKKSTDFAAEVMAQAGKAH